MFILIHSLINLKSNEILQSLGDLCNFIPPKKLLPSSPSLEIRSSPLGFLSASLRLSFQPTHTTVTLFPRVRRVAQDIACVTWSDRDSCPEPGHELTAESWKENISLIKCLTS